MSLTPRHARICAALSISALAFCAAGCVAVQEYPETSYEPKQELEGLSQYFGADVTSAHDKETSGDERKLLRDKVINGRIRATDINFVEFQKETYSQAVKGNIGTDISVLLINATGAVVGNTSEPFPLEPDDDRLRAEIALRIRAGAIRSWIEGMPPNKVLLTEWNLLGQND